MTAPARLLRRAFLGGVLAAPVASMLPGPVSPHEWAFGVDLSSPEWMTITVVASSGRIVGTVRVASA